MMLRESLSDSSTMELVWVLSRQSALMKSILLSLRNQMSVSRFVKLKVNLVVGMKSRLSFTRNKSWI